MDKKQKLELAWIGKEKRSRLELRMLILRLAPIMLLLVATSPQT